MSRRTGPTSSATAGIAVLVAMAVASARGQAQQQVQVQVQVQGGRVGTAVPAQAPAPVAERLQAEPTQWSAVLDLPDDGFLLGSLVPIAAAADRQHAFLSWKSPLFATAVDFAIDEVIRVRFPKGQVEAAPADAWRFDIRGGDMLIGRIESIDADHVAVMTSASVGQERVRIKREAIVRMSQVATGRKVFVPGSLAAWEAARGTWQEQAGRIVCDKAGSAAYRNVEAPARACYDLALAWDERPDLDILFAANVEQFSRLRAGTAPGTKLAATEQYRLEMTAGELLAIREGGAARFDLAGQVAAGPGSLRLQIFVDQASGRMAVVLPQGTAAEGKAAFDETVTPQKPDTQSGTGFAIRLRKGSVRIASLRVTPWSVAEPRLATESGLGSQEAMLESYDATTGEFVVRDGGETKRVLAAKVPEIEFAAAAPELALPAAAGTVLAGFNDGCRVTGLLHEVTKGAVLLEAASLADPLSCPLKHLAVLESVGPRAVRPLAGRVAYLEATSGRMLGCLVNPSPEATAGPAWQPRGGLNAAAFDAGQSGLRIEYRGGGVLGGVGLVVAKKGLHWVVSEVVAGGPAARDGRVKPDWRLESIGTDGGRSLDTQSLTMDEIRGLLRGLAGSTVKLRVADPQEQVQEITLVRDGSGRGDLAGAAEKDVLEKALKFQDEKLPASGSGTGAAKATVYLKTGDSILCAVLSGDADGLRVKTDGGENLLIPAAALRAVELFPSAAQQISKDKLARILTLPRMQQADPPTHMLRLPSGDYLRGKLVSLDNARVRMNVLGAVKELPRSEVSRLIWLSVEGDAAEQQALAAVVAADGMQGLSLQAVLADGRRLTMVAKKLDGDRLVGSSGVLGSVSVDLARCDYLLVGRSVAETQPRILPYSQWILKPAPLPRILQKQPPSAAAPAAAGAADVSSQTGKVLQLPPLPRLETGGKAAEPWSLAAVEGRIVVLTLCSTENPASMEALARVMEVAATFPDDAVAVVAVSEREPPAAVEKAIAALKPRPTILLDDKGVCGPRLDLGSVARPVHLLVDLEGRLAGVVRGDLSAAADELRQQLGKLVEQSRNAAGEFKRLAAARDAAVARDRACLTALGKLLEAESETVRQKAARLLRQLTGLANVDMPYKPDDLPDVRVLHGRRWQQWLANEGISAELTFPTRETLSSETIRPLRGRTMICRPQSNDVIELDEQGREVFKVGAQAPWACDVLENGHRLIGEFGGRAVVEYDEGGKQVWAIRNLPGGPMSVRRLENGNTLVALSDANLVAEYDADGKMAWSATVEGRPCDARRLPGGTTLVAAHRANRIVEIDAGGRVIWEIDDIEDPQAAQRLPSGNTLVAMSVPGIVREIDRDGQTVWQKEGFNTPVDAQRLPDGRTLVQEQTGPLIELDSDGKELERDGRSGGGSRFLRY